MSGPLGCFVVLVAFAGFAVVASSLRERRRRSYRATMVLVLLADARSCGAPPRRLLALSCGLGLGAGAAALIVTTLPIAALIATLFGAWIPWMRVRARARRIRQDARNAWPDAIDALRSGVRAGMSLAEATTELAERGPEVLRSAFAAFRSDYLASGSLETALDALRDRQADPVADRVVAALRIARQTGGADLGTVLGTLSDLLRVDARTRGEVSSRQSWTVNAARMAVAAPWLMLALLCTRPEAVQSFFSLGGSMVLMAAAVMSAVAYRLMLRIGRLPEDRRMLA